MPRELSEDTQGRIQALCDELGAAHDLQPELREELQSHIEDKLAAYLDGDQPLTETDAFILAREHFGDPKQLRRLLRQIHPLPISVGRRAVTVAFVFLAIRVTPQLLEGSVAYAVMTFRGMGLELNALLYVPYFCRAIPLFLAPFLAWRILKRMQRRHDAGHSPWLLRWPVPLVLLLCVLLYTASPFADFLGAVLYHLSSIGGLGAAATLPFGYRLPWLDMGLLGFKVAGLPLVWFWWCNIPRPRNELIRPAVYALALYCTAMFYQMDHFRVCTGSWTSAYPDATGILSAANLTWLWLPHREHIVGSLITLALIGVFHAGVGWVFYEIWLRFAKIPRAIHRPAAESPDLADTLRDFLE